METKWFKAAAFLAAGGLAVLLVTNVVLPGFFDAKYNSALVLFGHATSTDQAVAAHVPTPSPVKALYMTACVASLPSWREKLKSTIETTELNAVVIDIKDSTGTISFPTLLESGGKGCVVKDLPDFITELHKSHIYVIGRVSVFQDPSYAMLHPELAVKSKASGGVWKDRKGLSFVDVGATPYWDHVIDIAKASYGIGFDEINFDYVRYPSDGDMSDAAFSWTVGTSTKAEMLEGFFSYLHNNLKGTSTPLAPVSGAPVISADLFGMTTTVATDMGIGQVLERALPYFDYIAPMVYPSHYPASWSGFANPAEHPYEVIKLAMAGGRERELAYDISHGIATSTPSKLRPWLQDFNLGATYGPAEVAAQMQATYDVGLTSWALWSAGNTYTVAALKPDTGILQAKQ